MFVGYAGLLAVAMVTQPPIHFIYHADLDGQLAAPVCGKDGVEPPDYAALVATIKTVKKSIADLGEGDPVVLLGGDEIAPDLFARGILKWDGDAGAKSIVDAFKEADYAAVALGNHELTVDRSRLERFARSLHDANIPLVLSNVTCDSQVQPFCTFMQREVVVERQGQRIGILAVLSQRTLGGIAPDLLAGIDVQDPATAVLEAVARLRADGVNYIALMVQINSGLGGLTEVMDLQHALAAGGPDLIFSSGLANGKGDATVRLVRHDGAPPLVGSTTAAVSVSHVRVGDGGAVQVEGNMADPNQTDPTTAALLAPHRVNFCERYGMRVGPGKVEGVLLRNEFVHYTANVMRKYTGAEIAIVNDHIINAAPFPITGDLNKVELHRAMPYHATLGVAHVPGQRLRGLLYSVIGNPKAKVLGVSDTLQVNGRDLDDSRSYTVATVDFVANGGDGILPAGALNFVPTHAPNDLRAVVEAFLLNATALEDENPDISVRTDFGPDPSLRPLLVGRVDVGLNWFNSSVANPQIYSYLQLTLPQMRHVMGTFAGQFEVRHVFNELDVQLRSSYGYAWYPMPDGTTYSTKTVDLIAGSLVYAYSGLRAVFPGAPSYLLPDPYVRAFLESEFSRPAVTETRPRTWHHAELTATAGPQWVITDQLKVRVGVGGRRELRADPNSQNPDEVAVSAWRFVFNTGLTLTPLVLFPVGELNATLEGMLDYTAGLNYDHQVRGNTALSIPLLPLLYATAGVTLFAGERISRGWGTSYVTTFGLAVHGDAAYQKL